MNPSFIHETNPSDCPPKSYPPVVGRYSRADAQVSQRRHRDHERDVLRRASALAVISESSISQSSPPPAPSSSKSPLSAFANDTRSVRFSDRIESKHDVLGLGGYTDAEISACWYRPEDLRNMQLASRVVVHQQRRQQRKHQSSHNHHFMTDFLNDLMDDPSRGLEYEIDRERISARVRGATRAVLVEQSHCRCDRAVKKPRRSSDDNAGTTSPHHGGKDRRQAASPARSPSALGCDLRRVYEPFSDLAMKEARIMAMADQLAVKLDRLTGSLTTRNFLKSMDNSP